MSDQQNSDTHPSSLDSMGSKEKQHQQTIDSNNTINIGKDYKYTPQDLLSASPPNLKSRWQLLLYNWGFRHTRPKYLQEIYESIPRKIYVNQEIPDDLKHDGAPIITFPRNKIRTTKYTPLTFLPKNILFQFRNIANFYFLVLIVMGFFQIFGVQSPGLATVPLVVIVCITAIKDAFEDSRRTILDLELNNSPVHLLLGLPNHNGASDYVSTWRKFKKACTKFLNSIGKFLFRLLVMIFGSKKYKQKVVREQRIKDELVLRRISTVISNFSEDLNDIVSNHGDGLPNAKKSMQSTHSRVFPSHPLPNSILNPKLITENGEDKLVTKFKARAWKDINVGDFIRIRANEEVPADVVIISCSDPEGNCAIETKNLDGETNLKTKLSISCGGSNNLKHSTDLGNCKFWIECDAPNTRLYDFKGTIHFENYDERGNLINQDEKEAITNDNILLRGTTLRNTKWAIGVVVYTGQETKIMLNSGITPTKTSRISQELNLSVIINFVLLFLLCFISGLINGLFYNEDHTSRLYYEFGAYGSTPAINGIIAFFVSVIIYQALVPISLYISVEIIKTLQAFFIYSDIKLYYEKLNFPCIPKAWNISDDLGQIEYVFSDKTGTLTQNVMEFKKCTINGKSYGLAYTEAKQGLDRRNGKDVLAESAKWKAKIDDDKEEMLANLTECFKNDQLRGDKVTFVSNQYVEDTLLPNADSTQKSQNERFMKALALCHSVVTEENKLEPGLRDFKAESPDEAALVSVACDLGFVFKGRTRKSITLSVYGKDQEFRLLDTIPFTSDRKRMSSIIEDKDGKITLYCKGADNVIFLRLASNQNNKTIISKTALHLEDYAQEGLRTLCIAEKELDRSLYGDWSKRFKDAHSSIDDDRDVLIDEIASEIEKDLILLGGTAIEDRLQEGVPEAISILGKAGIKLWVLTGDRIETAINIGFSCNLLETDMKLLVVRPDENDMENFEYIDELITKYLQENFNILHENSSKEIERLIAEAKQDHSTPSSKYAVIIDGAALSIIFQNSLDDPNKSVKHLQQKFLLLGKQCKAVICCRVSPSQKAKVVRLVQQNLNVMTLAIGDGANDVAMIQAANVGIGIAGEEGRQAVMSSDYAIGQFRFLARLLLVHGRWSYKRLAEMVPCFFYKNVVFTLTLFWYGIYTNFDGSYLYEYTFLMFYNLAFTSLTVIVLAVLDQDVSDTVSFLVPQLYRSGILRLEWSQSKFLWYMLDGLYQSVISFYFPYLVYYRTFQNPQGLPVDHRFWMGVVCVIISVTACNVYVLLKQFRWDWLSLLIYAISILLVFFWTGIWSSTMNTGEFYKAASQVFGTLELWCVMLISIVLCVLPRFTFDFLRKILAPRDIDIIRERVRMGSYDEYPAGYDPTDHEDVERKQILQDLMMKNPQLLESLEKEAEKEAEKDKLNKPTHHNPVAKTFGTIKRHATFKSRKNTVTSHNSINDHFSKPINLEQLRAQMIKSGEYGTLRNSLERMSTTHELPGLTHAETLISYHTRNSINLS